MPVLKSSCCGCCTISTGARILGIISLILYGIQLLSFLGTLATFNAFTESIDCTNKRVVTHHQVESKHIDDFPTQFNNEGIPPPSSPNQPRQFGAADYGKTMDPGGQYNPGLGNFPNELGMGNYDNMGGYDNTAMHAMSLKLDDSAKDWLQHGLKSMSQFQMPTLEEMETMAKDANKGNTDKQKEDCEKIKKALRTAGYPILVICIIVLLYMVISSILLLCGISRRRRAFLLPWIIGESLAATVIGLVLLAILIFLISLGEPAVIGIAVFIGIVAILYVSICIYCILIVVSCYQELGLSHPCISYSPQQGGMVV